MVVNAERERREEDAILDAQQRAANQERSRRARQRLEALRQAEIESARAAAGLCVRWAPGMDRPKAGRQAPPRLQRLHRVAHPG